jgi:serine/threonine-protein kinase
VHAPPPDGDLVGTTLNGRYVVKARIGEGGFGAVYRGEQTAMGRECAIKVLHGRMARDQQVVGRFRREAQAASVLRAAHTVQIYDFDQTPEGVLYLAMELLHGRSLLSEMQKGPMPASRVAHILDGIADSLGEAHAQGIVHRDIKPENVFIETRGNDTDFAKVLDFGIAKIVSGGEGGLSGPQLTAAGQTLGTLEYMSPEQLMGQQLDGRSDLYALGMLAYEMLCGQHPYHAHLRQPGEIITAHIKTMPPPPSQARPDLGIPPLMDQIVMRLIEKPRDKRYRDAADLQRDLRRVDAGETGAPSTTREPTPPPVVLTVPPGTQPIELEGGPGAGAPTVPSLPAQRSSKTTMYLVGGVVLFLLAIGLAVLLFSGKASGAELPPPSQMIPSSYEAMVAIDFPKLRQALPRETVKTLVEALKPSLGAMGLDAAKLGRLALGVGAPGDAVSPAAAEKQPAVFIVDAPLDRKKFDAWASRELQHGERYTSAAYKGVRYRKSAVAEYALLPGDRLLVATRGGIATALDLLKGQGTPLVATAAAGLLARVGVAPEKSPVFYGWAKLDEGSRRQLAQSVPAASALEELAAALELGPGGADLRAVGRCLSVDGAKQAADASRAALQRAQEQTMVRVLGLAPLVGAVKVDADGAELSLSLHLSAQQYEDLLTRVAGLVAAAAAEAQQNPAAPDGSLPKKHKTAAKR